MLEGHTDICGSAPVSTTFDLGAAELLLMCLHLAKLAERAETERDALTTALCM